MIDLELIQRTDPETAAAMERELGRQRGNIELIASENFVSPAVMAAMGSHLTNKYAEGYPGKRYYGGCEFVDEVENLAIERAKALFGCEHVNVQPHSGARTISFSGSVTTTRSPAVHAASLIAVTRILSRRLKAQRPQPAHFSSRRISTTAVLPRSFMTVTTSVMTAASG